jgi:hypothetical protein
MREKVLSSETVLEPVELELYSILQDDSVERIGGPTAQRLVTMDS